MPDPSPRVAALRPQERIGRAVVSMAAGTAASRLTGLLRVIALAYALGATHLADAYNLANTTPNMLYDIALGGVLAATFIPVFVDRLATRPDGEAWHAISSIVTVSVVVLVAMTVLFWILAPQVIDAYTAFSTRAAGSGLAAEKAVATSLLRWFVPQVALYGAIALVSALLNTRRRFAAPMWVPIANNVVVIGVLLWFHHLAPRFPSLAGVQANSSQLVVLGLGTTAGVALQALLLLPALRGAGVGRLRWRFQPGHEAVRAVLRLGGWTFGFVVANQVALYIVLALAVGTTGPDPVSAYTYAYTVMQMPYAVVAVSVMSAVTPELSERWATGDVPGFRRRLATGLRGTLAVILPASVGMLILARPAIALLLGHGTTSVHTTAETGAALALFSVGLPGFCTYLYVVRVLQSMQRTKVAFWLYLVENGLNVILAVALVHPMGVRGLALSLAVAYTVAAAVGIVVLRRWLGTLGGARMWTPLRRVVAATAVMGAAVVVVSNLSGATQGLGLLVRVVASVVAGAAVYAGAAVVLGGRGHPLRFLAGASRGGAGRLTDRRDLGAGAGLGGTAWGDPRVPVNTGSRIRIVPAPGSAAARAGSAGAGGGADNSGEGSSGGAGGAGAGGSAGGSAARLDHRGRPGRSPDPGDPARGDVGAVRPVARSPQAARRAAVAESRHDDPSDPADNEDDPGERRWLGGTPTGLRRPRPR